jgi:DinB superfamily
MDLLMSTVALASLLAVQQTAAAPAVGVAAVLQGTYGGLKSLVTGEAAKMPDAGYGSKPSTMPEVRTFGQVIAHIAEGQFDTCARVRGIANPNEGKQLERTLKTKAEFEKALADSFAFCDEAFSATTDENALKPVRMQFGPRTIDLPRVSVLYGLIAHTSEMYGIGTVYLRAKGLVPPASEPAGGRGR